MTGGAQSTVKRGSLGPGTHRGESAFVCVTGGGPRATEAEIEGCGCRAIRRQEQAGAPDSADDLNSDYGIRASRDLVRAVPGGRYRTQETREGLVQCLRVQRPRVRTLALDLFTACFLSDCLLFRSPVLVVVLFLCYCIVSASAREGRWLYTCPFLSCSLE